MNDVATTVVDMIKGAFVSLLASLVVAILFAYIFRIPIFMVGYMGPFGDISFHGVSVKDVIWSILFTWVIYGGLILPSLLGAIAGLFVSRIYVKSSVKNLMIIVWSIVSGIIPVFILSILDFIIGPW